IASGILPATVDQDQSVLAGHATDADVESAGLAGALAHVDTFHILKRFGQVAVRLLLQLFLADHTDARRSLGNLLFKARSTDNHGVQVYRIVIGEGRQAAAEKGDG